MSGYSDIEALWLARVRAISGYSDSNTSRGKWGILNSGASERYVIVKPGSRDRQMNSIGGGRLETSQTVIEVWQKYRDDGDTLTTLQTAVDTLLDALDRYPRLGGLGSTIRQGEIAAVREVMQIPADAPQWLKVELIGETDEETVINYQE